jgi:hypothetical protein
MVAGQFAGKERKGKERTSLTTVDFSITVTSGNRGDVKVFDQTVGEGGHEGQGASDARLKAS